MDVVVRNSVMATHTPDTMPAFVTGNKDQNRNASFDEKNFFGEGGVQIYRLLKVFLPAVGQSVDEGVRFS